MKKLILGLLIAIPCLCIAQTGTPIFAINNGIISVNSQFIDPIYDAQRADSLSYIGIDPVNVSVGDKTYTIKRAMFTDWLQYELGYTVIEVSYNNQTVLVHKQILSMELFNETENAYGQTFRPYTDNNYFIKVPLSDSATALIFVGWPYDSTPSKLLILVLTPTDAKIVYYKNMYIDRIAKEADKFLMALQSNSLDSGEGTPEYHAIFNKDGILLFK